MPTSATSSPGRVYKGESPSKRAATRRRKFLAAGKTVFGEAGLQKARIKDICATAGLTERYYYEAFGSLPKLFEAVYLQALEELRRTLDAADSGASQDSEVRLRSIIQAYFELLERDRHLARVLNIEIYGAAPAIDNLYKQGVRQFAERLYIFFDPGALASRNQDRELTAVALIGVTSSLAMHWYLDGYRKSVATMTDNCMAIFSAALWLRRPTGER